MEEKLRNVQMFIIWRTNKIDIKLSSKQVYWTNSVPFQLQFRVNILLRKLKKSRKGNVFIRSPNHHFKVSNVQSLMPPYLPRICAFLFSIPFRSFIAQILLFPVYLWKSYTFQWTREFVLYVFTDLTNQTNLLIYLTDCEQK